MSTFSDMAATTHALSVVAMEEASRRGERVADLDHLLVALTVSEHAAGRALRRMGITRDAARAAVELQHAEQLSMLGVTTRLPAAGRPVFHETEGYEWSDRATRVLRSAAAHGGDAAAVLRELAREPSGLIEAVLHRLGTTPCDVVARVDDGSSEDATGQDEQTPGGVRTATGALSRERDFYLPAPPQDVWNLVSDPLRLPEWEPGVASVRTGARLVPPESGPEVGPAWEALSPTAGPDGAPLRVKPEHRRQHVELRECVEGALVTWCMTYPDAPAANSRIVSMRLVAEAGGTQLSVTCGWERAAGRCRGPVSRALGVALRPLHRGALEVRLSQVAGGIRRALS